MSPNRKTPEPRDEQFWIDLPAPPPSSQPALPKDAETGPSIDGGDAASVFSPPPADSGAAPVDADPAADDLVADDLTEPADAEDAADDGPVVEGDVGAAPEFPAAGAAAPDLTDDEIAMEGVTGAEPVPGEHDAMHEDGALEEEDGAAGFVPVVLGGALALAIAVGLEAAGLWSTLLPP